MAYGEAGAIGRYRRSRARAGSPSPSPGTRAAAAAAAVEGCCDSEERALAFRRETIPRSYNSSAAAQPWSQMCPLGMALPDEGEWENRQERPPSPR